MLQLTPICSSTSPLRFMHLGSLYNDDKNDQDYAFRLARYTGNIAADDKRPGEAGLAGLIKSCAKSRQTITIAQLSSRPGSRCSENSESRSHDGDL
jgi:hypothetical protein